MYLVTEISFNISYVWDGDTNVSVLLDREDSNIRDMPFVSNFHTTNKSPNFKTLARKINFSSVMNSYELFMIWDIFVTFNENMYLVTEISFSIFLSLMNLWIYKKDK